jgi:Ice-binding-like/Bacterial Ig-like domain
MTYKAHSPISATFLLALLIGCAGTKADDSGPTSDGGGDQVTVPTVTATVPLDAALDVLLNATVSATFSEDMAGDLLDGAFLVASGDPAVNVAGTVIYAAGAAIFWPAEHFVAGTVYTATVTTDAESALGEPLADDYSWVLTTGLESGPGLPVPLGSAGDFVVLAKSGISSVPASVITGDIGVSPAAATYITGFSLTADASNEFATSPQVVGNVYASDYSAPTPAKLTAAVSDMELAFTDAAGRAPDVTELGAGAIGGMDLPSGVYRWGTGLLIATDLMLTGSATDVWTFQIAQDLTVANGAQVTLAGGALPKNVFWQVAGAVDLGTTSHIEGVILTQTAVTMQTLASINGRLYAQTAIELDSATVTEPAP